MHDVPPATAAMRLPTHVLVVEDDEEIATLVARYLGGQGLRVTEARSGDAAMAAVANAGVDVVLLDLGLPGEDGLVVLRRIQSAWHGPVIIVSGRSEPIERVIGLELGADDYVAKPFDFRELLARIRSVLRRHEPLIDPGRANAADTLHFEDLRLERAARRLVRTSGDEIPLSSGEFSLLSILADKPGHVFSRDALMQHLHGHEAGPYDRSIDVQIARLRRKIEDDPEHPRIIKSVRGVGYVFTPALAATQ